MEKNLKEQVPLGSFEQTEIIWRPAFEVWLLIDATYR